MEPKEIPTFVMPPLLVVFTQQLDNHDKTKKFTSNPDLMTKVPSGIFFSDFSCMHGCICIYECYTPELKLLTHSINFNYTFLRITRLHDGIAVISLIFCFHIYDTQRAICL